MVELARKLTFDEIVKAVERLSPEERETLSLLCDKELTQKILIAREEAREALKAGKTVPLDELFKDLD